MDWAILVLVLLNLLITVVLVSGMWDLYNMTRNFVEDRIDEEGEDATQKLQNFGAGIQRKKR